MKRIYKLLLALLSGVLLSAAWPERGFPVLLFVGFVPLLVVEYEQWKNRGSNHSSGFLPYAALTVSVWVALTTWWVYNSTPIGIVATILVNTSLVGGALYLFHITHRRLSGAAAYTALIGYMLTAEYIHLRWDLNFPWLNLGNGFATWPKWIQWYEFTGIFGGSLWILLVNILLFLFVRDRVLMKICSRQVGMRMAATVLLVVLPVLVSLVMYRNYEEKPDPVDVVLVQPNIDPYNEQYDLDPLLVTERMINLAAQKTDSLTDFVVFPESAIQEYVFEDHMDFSPSLKRLRNFNRQYSRVNTVAGISSRKIFEPGEPLSASARKFSDADRYYDSYNTALFIAHDSTLQKYHKSKLTPGVEIMPLVHYLPFIEKLALDLGGTVGSLGVNPDQTPFVIDDHLKIAPVICYESVYGEFLNRFVQNGANAIFVITNDGWWGNTPGHRQHMLFSVLRAIETRRSVARSANTGISCFINQRGDISQRTDYWVPAVIRGSINANNAITFYVKHGDYIGRIFLAVAALFALMTMFSKVIYRGKNVKI